MIKPIYFTRTSLCVCTVLCILFVVFLFLLSAAFDKYSTQRPVACPWMTLSLCLLLVPCRAQLDERCPVFSACRVDGLACCMDNSSCRMDNSSRMNNSACYVGDDCPICMAPFESNDGLRRLTCHHCIPSRPLAL